MNNDINMSINDKDFIEKFVELKKENTRLKQERENFIYQSNSFSHKLTGNLFQNQK